MEQKNTDKISWIENHKFTTAVLVMAVIWGSLFWYFISYGNAISTDPCSVCAEQMGEKVHCTAGNTVISEKTFYPNGSIDLYVPERSNRNLYQGPIQEGYNESNFRETGEYILKDE